ncbi:HlyD family efflux transporter periplasmic adaptor subunit [Halomonas sp. EF61]|uniref:efflux RND transporter periplasmic adaptor subunit n=1 Tax=Halomonas sp. EF61 TaxID=2950869 RepID=UPI0032DFFCBA
MLKRLLPILVLAIGVGGFWLLKVTRPAPPPVTVEEREWPVAAMTLSLGRHAPTLALYGEVLAPDRLRLVASLDGHVGQRPVRDGDRVEEGDLLVALAEEDVVPVVTRAEAEVARLEAEIEAEKIRFESDRQALAREQSLLDNARSQLERMRSLVRRNLASRAELDADENEIARAQVTLVSRQGELDGHPARLTSLEAQRRQAEASLAEARRDARRARAEAPFAGIVTAVEVAPGDRVREGDALLDLIPLDGLEVRARVPRGVQSELVSSLADGARPEAVDDEGGRYRLRALSGQGDPAGTEAILEVVSSPARLRPGSLVSLSLARPEVADSAAIPFSALYGADRIYVIEQGRLRPIEVRRHGETSGPDGGSWVIVSGEGLADGQRLAITHLPNAIEGLRVVDLSRGSGPADISATQAPAGQRSGEPVSSPSAGDDVRAEAGP